MRQTLGLLGCVVCGAVACGEVRGTAVGVDGGSDAPGSSLPDGSGSGPPDGPDSASSTVEVSTTGDDAGDGIARPVKTLKRAFALAVADGRITRVSLASGTYGAANGETFPYAVPANLTITGSGAKLVGAASDGLILESGELDGIELSGFAVAVAVVGTATLHNVRIESSSIGVRVARTAKLTATELDITGAAGACATGIAVQDTATLSANDLTTRELGTSIQMVDRSTVELTSPRISGDAACNKSSLAVSGATLTITEGDIDAGTTGIEFSRATPATVATITDTRIGFMAGAGLTGSTVALTMTGGDLRGSDRGLVATGGSWTFTNVAIIQNDTRALEISGASAAAPGSLYARGCDISVNGDGILLSAFGVADLGTVASPGNNEFGNNSNINLNLAGTTGASMVTAIGNTWRSSTQGSDVNGKYPQPATVVGPVAAASRNNFALGAGWSLIR
jgi:hypothetical protein